MKKTVRIQLKPIFLLLIVFTLTSTSCSFLGLGSEETDESDAKIEADEDEDDVGLGSDYTEIELFFEGLRSYDGERYSLAKTMFAKLINKFPASPLVIVAELKLADSLFYGQKYPEAIGAYRDFNNLHSTHEATPYALYQIARSYQLAYQGSKQDETPIKEANKAYLNLINQFPDSYFSYKARNSILECDRALLNSEKDVIEFYIKTDKLEAAKARLTYAKANYGHLPEIDSILNFDEITIANEIKSSNPLDTALMTDESGKTDLTQKGEDVIPHASNPEEISSLQEPPTDQDDDNDRFKDEKVLEKSSSLITKQENSGNDVDLSKEKPASSSIKTNEFEELDKLETPSNIESKQPEIISAISQPTPTDINPTKVDETKQEQKSVGSKEEKFTEELLKAEALASSKKELIDDRSNLPPTKSSPIDQIKPFKKHAETIENDIKRPPTLESNDDKFEKMKRLASTMPSSGSLSGNLGDAELVHNEVIKTVSTTDLTTNTKTLSSLESSDKESGSDIATNNLAKPDYETTTTKSTLTSAESPTIGVDNPKVAAIFLKNAVCNSNEDGTQIMLDLKTPPIIRSSKNHKQNGVFGANTYQIKLVLQNQLSIVPQASDQDFGNNEENWIITKLSNCQNTFDKIKIFEATRRTIDPSGFEPSATINLVIDSVSERKLGISYSQNREKVNISVK